jgi:two-component system sensor histidine kinase/response regulator
MAFARADQRSVPMPRCALLAADPERERLDALAADLRIDAMLAKPFTPGTLDDALAELHSGAPAPAPSRRPAHRPPGRACACSWSRTTC